MISFDRVSFTYPQASQPVLREITLEITDGELALVVGATGSGKTTFLRSINGLVPHFSGGHLQGSITINGRTTESYPPRELADLVGFVPQDPVTGFVTDLVEDELAYSMESLGVNPQTMRRRVEETLDLLGLADLRNRPLRTLSGGQQQRVAIGSVLTAHPQVLVLDEPTSALDPGAAEEVLAALHRLVHDLGVTVVMAEHRLERVVQYADSVLMMENGQVRNGAPSSVMAESPIAPPVIHLGRLAGWNPLPVSIRDARRSAGPLRSSLADQRPRLRVVPETTPVIARVTDLDIGYRNKTVLRDINIEFNAGEIIALMGRNGAGKSTLLRTLIGLHTPNIGTVRVNDIDPARVSAKELLHHVGLVPQEPSDLFEAHSVALECRNSDKDAGCEPGTTRALLALMAPEIVDSMHPRDLSEGQQMILALCMIVAAKPPLILLDEPTRGLDYPTKTKLADILRGLAETGHVIVMATHDVELVADLATRVIMLGDSEIVADGATGNVITGSPMFAPQVAKIMAPQQWLTVDQVERALSRIGEVEPT
jgi:energy-coupling factor transport system ATP-binding protein